MNLYQKINMVNVKGSIEDIHKCRSPSCGFLIIDPVFCSGCSKMFCR